MERRYVLFLVLGLQVCITASAQKDWSAKDSLWLQRVLSGQEKLKLNEETLRAIRSGTLINPAPTPEQQMKHSPLELPIVKSFDSIIRPESHRKLHLLPPSVFMLYDLNKNNKSANDPDRGIKTTEGTVLSKRQIEGMQKYLKRSVDDALKYSNVGPPSIRFSAEDIARTIFWPSHRAKKRNARDAQAYKQFEVAPPSISKEEHERRRLNEYINRLKEHAKKRLLSDSIPHQPDSVDVDFRIWNSR